MIKSADSQLRWLYAIEQPSNDDITLTKVFIRSLNLTTGETKIAELQLQNRTQFYFEDYMYSGNMDCFYVQNYYDSSLQFYRYNGSDITFVADIVSELFPANFPKSKDVYAEMNVQLAAGCAIVRVLNKTYSLMESGGVMSFQLIVDASLDFTKMTFDTTLIFAILQQDVYKYDGKVYQKIFTG